MESEVISLGKCSNFLLTMLGDFCSQNGMDAKIQKDYKDETTKTAFGKYNQDDGKSIISEQKIQFCKKVLLEYKAYSKFSTLLLQFPSFLQKSIYNIDPQLLPYFSSKQIITFLINQYAAYHYKNVEENRKSFFKDCLLLQITNSYNDILKDTKVNIKMLKENCNWSSLEEILKVANMPGQYQKKREQILDCRTLVQHYLYLGFKKALREVFNFTEEEIRQLEVYIVNKLDTLVNRQNYYIQNFSYSFYENLNLPVDRSENIIFSFLNFDCKILPEMFYTEEEWDIKVLKTVDFKSLFKSNIKYKAIIYFINSHTRIIKEKTKEYLKKLEDLNDEYFNKIMIPWFKARSTLFSLTFTDKKKDEELKKEACNLFRETFTIYKYQIGNNLKEFLSDAIACDVYCNPKKDIFDNSQDDTDESSIIMPGKAYWEFGYALDIFDQDSKKTYLLTFNAEDNFWTNFPVTKFENQKQAFEVFYNETRRSEFELPDQLKEFDDYSKIDNLLSPDRKDFRQKLGIRYYSNLTIRCLKAKKISRSSKEPADFSFINNFIKNNKVKVDLLFTSDENGANALIRSLERYKMLSFGYSDKEIEERARIFSDFYQKWNQGQFKIIAEDFPDSQLFDLKKEAEIYEYQKKCWSDFIIQIGIFYNKAITECQNSENERENLKTQLKEKVILPLIENGGKHLLDEALVLDGQKCVSALQIAIDSFDFEIVKAIVENVSEKIELSQLLISSEYVTVLQYAVRKYDYLMQYTEMLCKKEAKIELLEKREIHSRKKVDKGILTEDKDFYLRNDLIYHYLEISPQEECGLFLTAFKDESNKNILSLQQKNLFEIIKLLAEKTNPISVDTFYYLADIIDPKDGHVFSDVFDITKILIESGHAELSGTDFEWDRYHLEPSQTLLAYCINHTKKDNNPGHRFQQKNYDMLNFLLSKYPHKFKNSINQLVQGLDNDGSIRYDTDLHFFITNQIESIKAWNNMNDEERQGYGENIASRMSHFLTLFLKAGASFSIPDYKNMTALDYLKDWQNKMPQGCIPKEIIKMIEKPSANIETPRFISEKLK